MALATMLVVAIAVLGSLTVLPAVLAKLGDRVNRGRLPGMSPRGVARAASGALWPRRHAPPAGRADDRGAALVVLAAPALDMQTSGSRPRCPPTSR